MSPTPQQRYEVEQILGISYEWFKQVDKACDFFFKTHGIKWNNLSVRQQIHAMAVEQQQKKRKR